MKYIGISLIYMAFFSLIGLACYWTESAWCLLALFLTPEYTDSGSDEK